MTTPIPSSESVIVYRKLADLTIHPLAAKMPMLDAEAPEMRALVISLELHGLERQPLIINERDEIMDGRHRKLAGKLAGLTDVPCIVRPDEEAASIIVESLVGRRHYRKGARAYLVAPLLIAAAKVNKEARENQLSVGRLLRKPIQSVFGKSETEFAAQFGFSGDVARQAKDVHTKFVAADERLAKWREKFPDLVKQIGPGKLSEYPMPEWAQPVPEDLRERFEPQILSGDMGLGAVLQAIAGLESTKGQPRVENGKSSLFFQAMKTFQLRFGYWETFTEDEKREAAKAFADFTVTLPDEVRGQIITSLAKK